MSTTSLWAMTTYFNPAGYRRRRENYRIFRQQLKVPLVTVEASRDGHFELVGDDADQLVQLRCPDVLWLKERLLNVALRALPASCTHVAWIDCDVVFDSDDWPERATEALSSAELVHLCTSVRHVARDADAKDLARAPVIAETRSLADAWVRREVDSRVLRSNTLGGSSLGTGYAWAAHRSLLARHGFYDACIVGGADKVTFAAAVGHPHEIIDYHHMNPAMAEHYLGWARGFGASVGGRLAALPGALHHLWHGDLASRSYAARHALLDGMNFDPAVDLGIEADGAMRWATAKPELHARVRSYFDTRREDG
jgi:hypothetical protein